MGALFLSFNHFPLFETSSAEFKNCEDTTPELASWLELIGVKEFLRAPLKIF
jgi:hypothetical protein